MLAQTRVGAKHEAVLESQKVHLWASCFCHMHPGGLLILRSRLQVANCATPPSSQRESKAAAILPWPRRHGQPWGKECRLPSPVTGYLVSPGRALLGPACSRPHLPPPGS